MPADLARAETLFNECLTHASGPARAAFLDQSCGEDVELRKHMDRLLAAHETAGSFMPQPAVGPTPYVAVQEHPGSMIGRYKLLQQIGEGGFGVVFMAEQEEPVRRKVALKIIKLGMDTRQIVARFEAERQALAMMDHPAVAKVLDGGATDTGRPYFVMELVKGVPITQYCDRNSLDIAQRLSLFEQVCQAVQHAHQKGLIHRDIKPSNILVSTQDNRALAKVIDFGIAKAMQARLTEKTLFTEFHQLIGTPEYMSPEQAEGSLDIDTRSDIFSLGVLLYELLTGATPFDAKELRSKAYAEMQRIIREVEPPKPSTRLSAPETLPAVAAMRSTEPRKLSATVRGELDWIVMKALEKERARRYESASALAADVMRYLSDEPVSAAAPSSIYRLNKFVRRNQKSVLVSAIFLLLLLSGIVGTTIGLVGETRQRAVAEQQRNEAQRQRADARDNLAGLLYMQSRGAEAEAVLREELDAPTGSPGHGSQDTAARLNLYGKVLFDYRRPVSEVRVAEAVQALRQSIQLYRAAKPPDEADLAEGLIDLGNVLTASEQYSEGEAAFREAVEIGRRTMPPNTDLLAEYLLHLGHVLGNENKDLVEAESLDREALSIFEANHKPPLDWRLSNAHYELATVAIRLGRFHDAEAEMVLPEQACRLNPTMYPWVLRTMVNLYSAWNQAEPGKGYDVKARLWQQRLDALPALRQTIVARQWKDQLDTP